MVSNINKKYPGTDDRSFKEAQDKIGNYIFEEGEAANAINIGDGARKDNKY